MRDIGKNIRDLRIAQNLTQDQLAEKLFVTRQTVSNYENGKSRPDIDMIVKISEVLECDVNTVLYGVQDNVRKTEYIKLTVCAVVTLVIVVAYLYLRPVTMQLRREHYIISFDFLLGFTLIPLIWMLTGWTVMQLACVAFKTRLPVPKWTKYARYALIAFVIIFFTLVFFALLPVTADDIIYLLEKSKGLSGAYTVHFSDTLLALRDWALITILYKFIYPADIRIPVFLAVGIALWLCGFPKNNKPKSTNDEKSVQQGA
ncbi:MAG: helix-turn-helix transcriptional regulator [Ruminococcaceae bacterium]|nr:helix-turn-helix transcriptional regulator [Oscillospiraceae bacterium]